MYYAIRRRDTKEYISGTDFNYNPPRQIMASEYRTPRLFTNLDLEIEIKHRKINLKRYEVVAVTIIAENN